VLNSSGRDQLAVAIGARSTAGRKPVNQDFHGAMTPHGAALTMKGVALAIADGISSSAVSRIAAETAVGSFLSDYYCTSDAWSVKTSGHSVIAAVNAWLHAETRRDHRHEDRNRGYICTFSALVLKGRTAHLFHVGDSRIFRSFGAALEQVTTDHRTVLSSTESYLARALGLADQVEIEYQALSLAVGDVFVMTTDGVHAFVSGRDIAASIAATDDLDAAARAIVDRALANGSDDNATIQIARIDRLPPGDARAALSDVDVMLPAPPLPLPPEFEGYRILRPLHASSRSQIFVAIDQASGDRVALKVPAMDLRDNVDLLRRFAMEEWIARRINAPHVLKAAPAHRERTALYVATELLEGQTLRQWMADHPKPELRCVRDIVEQIARGLGAFHRKEMLHQDLRPENVMIDDHGTVKIIDFGAVRVAGVLEADPSFETNEILGTHQYAAPEYFVADFASDRSDLYSLGVIVYEMLTGRLPYDARMAQATSRARQSRVAYVPIATFRPDVPFWVDRAIRKAVHFDPRKRQETLSEFMRDLRQPAIGPGGGARLPLIERNPLVFWKAMTAVLALVILLLFAWR
jgi:Serine/threonine protein kinase